MALRAVEGQIEEFVESVMARAFRSGLQPVEIGKRLRRVAVRDRRVSVKGVATAANHFQIELSEDDHERILSQSASITAELVEEVRSAVRNEGLSLGGAVEVVLVADPERRPGTFSIESSFNDVSVHIAAGVQLADGSIIEAGPDGLQLGRHHNNDVVIEEANVSRFHAQVVPSTMGWQLVDSGSTNGTRVNGRSEREAYLADLDLITIGSASVTFRLL